MIINSNLKSTLEKFFSEKKRITVLTGAGISAESGVPTFRGKEGYWTIGSKVYQPQEIATFQMFLQNPEEVWKWFLYRRGVCRDANPNLGHEILVEMEKMFENRFTLITQNVDGLHLRAGNSSERTFQIHGNLNFMRCAEECSLSVYLIPEEIRLKERGEEIPPEQWEKLQCPKCGKLTRPHVLWWDESYNEEFYRFQSSLEVAQETGLLIVVGTSGATNLPNQVVDLVSRIGGIVIDVNIEENPFSRMALKGGKGFFLQHSGSEALPEILNTFRAIE